jgi:hypothetical protein
MLSFHVYCAVNNFLCVIDMAQLTSAVTDEEIVGHFQTVIAPYCMTRQMQLNEIALIQQPSTSKDLAKTTFETSLLDLVQGLDSKCVSCII